MSYSRHDTLNGGTRERIRRLRAYVRDWNAKADSGDRRYMCRQKFPEGFAGLKQARGHGIARLSSYAHGPRVADDGNSASIPACVLDGLRGGKFADDILSLRHRGWFADADQDETYRGQVWQLPTHRGELLFLAGFTEANSGYSVLDCTRGKIAFYDSERDAAHAADELARIHAEREREHSERWQQAQQHDSEREEAREQLREARSEAREAIEALREQRKLGDIAPKLCAVLERKVTAAHKAMRRHLRAIAKQTEAITELGMAGEF